LRFAVKHNNVLPNQHFRKAWAERVKTWLDQPKRKERRRRARQEKAAAIAPRPLEKLRPVVRCQTQRYNTRVRAGRGFTLDELKAAGVNARVAVTIGIAVDHRRTNKSAESLNENVARLKAYLAKVIVAPRKSGAKHVKKGDAARAEFKDVAQHSGAVLPIRQPAAKIEFAAVTEAMRDPKRGAYKTLRQERINQKLEGRRKKRAAEAAAEAPAAPAAE
jgi:large subunit ribosomal protein L13e